MNESGTVVDPRSPGHAQGDVLLLLLSTKDGQYPVRICRDGPVDKVFVEMVFQSFSWIS